MVQALTDFAAWIWTKALSFAQWLMDLILYVPRVVFQQMTEGAVDAVNLVPCANACYQTFEAAKIVLSGVGVPDSYGAGAVTLSWLQNILYVTALGVGVELVVCALLARFILRRIPFIG